MKHIVITSGEVVGYKKPILWVVDENKWTKVASFNSETAVDLLIETVNAKDLSIIANAKRVGG